MPAAQIKQPVELEALALLVVPAGHARHALSTALPEEGLYVEGGQGVQREAPVAEEKEPGGQGRHDVEEGPPAAGLKVPAPQGAQSAALTLMFFVP